MSYYIQNKFKSIPKLSGIETKFFQLLLNDLCFLSYYIIIYCVLVRQITAEKKNFSKLIFYFREGAAAQQALTLGNATDCKYNLNLNEDNADSRYGHALGG